MSIIYPLSMPLTPGFAAFQITFMPVVAVSSSPYDMSQEVQEYAGQGWQASIRLGNLNAERRALWRSFVGKLNGRSGTFLLRDPLGRMPRGTAGSCVMLDASGRIIEDNSGNWMMDGGVVVDGAHSARAQELSILGAPPDEPGWLLEGDQIQLGSGAATRLHLVLADIDTDADGKATIPIWPRTRTALGGGEGVSVADCKGIFRMAQNAQSFGSRPGPLTDYGFDCVEAL